MVEGQKENTNRVGRKLEELKNKKEKRKTSLITFREFVPPPVVLLAITTTSQFLSFLPDFNYIIDFLLFETPYFCNFEILYKKYMKK